MSQRWLVRFGTLVVLDTLLLLGLDWTGYEADEVRLSLLVTACLALAWLVADTVTEGGPPWTVHSRTVTRPPGSDARLATYVRVLEDHRVAREPNSSLRDRLAALADERLQLHHGLRLGDPRAHDLLGPELAAALSGPPRRLRAAELDAYVSRIEEL